MPRHEIVQALIETLGFRHIGVVHDEYAVSPDGMKALGALDLATEMEGCRFSIRLRNSHSHSHHSLTHSKSPDFSSVATVAHVTPLAATVAACILENPTAVFTLAFAQP